MSKKYVIMGAYDDIGVVPIIELEEGLTLREAEIRFHSFCYHPTESEELMAGDVIAMWLEEGEDSFED